MATSQTRRPAGVIGNAVKVMRIATGEEPEEYGRDEGKDPVAVALGRRGGQARASKLSNRKKREIAKKAARARWGQE